ncbi:hypothetical protein FEM48_Zijuj08G0201500 [Ziziphus jujuba var. spinosa]|uniref:Polygalacturonase QRT3-like n=1 Tax=Ziziphus jujuba var. spinosa TaxID=714518 RepID=A0A978V148_ZIZJJ|nr:hypothetical protein FEM48_Zijuj08G0201500 [Ziziphus jujuba var. spinosa]
MEADSRGIGYPSTTSASQLLEMVLQLVTLLWAVTMKTCAKWKPSRPLSSVVAVTLWSLRVLLLLSPPRGRAMVQDVCTTCQISVHIQSLLDAAAAEAPSAQSVLSSAGSGPSEGSLTAGVPNKAGTADFQGGTYKVRKSLQVPPGGNIVIKDGTIQASDDFHEGSPVIDASPKQTPPTKNTESFVDDIEPAQLSPDPSSFSFEYITFQNIMIDSNHRGAGISLSNALRTSIENVYVSHFSTTGINVHPSSSETYITNSFLGQHPTAGRDPHERNFTGTAINLSGTNNALTDVVLFSSAVGVDVSGHDNTLSGVHCYNKATRFGGTGIYLRKSGLGQNRIINSYLDYTGIVAEDPLQLHISNSFFRGDAFVALKSIKGVVGEVNIVDNTFSGSNKGTGIVQLQ